MARTPAVLRDINQRGKRGSISYNTDRERVKVMPTVWEFSNWRLPGMHIVTILSLVFRFKFKTCCDIFKCRVQRRFYIASFISDPSNTLQRAPNGKLLPIFKVIPLKIEIQPKATKKLTVSPRTSAYQIFQPGGFWVRFDQDLWNLFDVFLIIKQYRKQFIKHSWLY